MVKVGESLVKVFSEPSPLLQQLLVEATSYLPISLEASTGGWRVVLVPKADGLSETHHVEPPQVLEVEIGSLLAHDLGQKVRKLVEAADDPQVA